MCHAQAFCACWKPLTGIHFCLFQGCVVFWERIIVHIHQRLGNLEKTYLGDLQLPMSDVWMLIYEHDQSNTYNIVFDELRINFIESYGLKCPVYLYKLFSDEYKSFKYEIPKNCTPLDHLGSLILLQVPIWWAPCIM